MDEGYYKSRVALYKSIMRNRNDYIEKLQLENARLRLEVCKLIGLVK